MKIAIVYISPHHGNTEKVVKAMQEQRNIDLYKTHQIEDIDFSKYDCIGFASGIYMNKFHKTLLKAMQNIELHENQKTFLVYTCGFHYRNYAFSGRKILQKKTAQYIGCFWCKGWDTVSFLSKIGGIAKGHPNAQDLKRAKQFISQL